MKTIKIVIALLMLSTSVSYAQKTIALNAVYNGKTVLQTAKEYDLSAFNETKEIYKTGMTENTFVDLCLKGFPSNYSSLRSCYVSYAKYLYSFHKRGLTDQQVLNEVDGEEFVDCANQILIWKQANPGIDPPVFSWWRDLIHWAAIFLTWLDEVLPQ